MTGSRHTSRKRRESHIPNQSTTRATGLNTLSVLSLKVNLREVIIRVTPFQLEQPMCLLVGLEERELLVVGNFITMGEMVGAVLLHLVAGTLHPKI